MLRNNPTPITCRQCSITWLTSNPRQFYCGSLRNRTGCSWLVRRRQLQASHDRHRLRILERDRIRRRRPVEYRRCERCELRFLVVDAKQRLCGSIKKKLGCSWVNRLLLKNCYSVKRWNMLRTTGTYAVSEWIKLLRVFDYTCPACNRRGVPLSVDHKIPVKLGGTNTLDNLQPLCVPCNVRKFTKVMFAASRISDRLMHLVQY